MLAEWRAAQAELESLERLLQERQQTRLAQLEAGLRAQVRDLSRDLRDTLTALTPELPPTVPVAPPSVPLTPSSDAPPSSAAAREPQAWGWALAAAVCVIAAIVATGVVRRTPESPAGVEVSPLRITPERGAVSIRSSDGGASSAALEAAPAVESRSLLMPRSGLVNVALARNGAVASASSIYRIGGATGWFEPESVINGDRRGAPWELGGGWSDETPNAWPDWFEVAFDGPKTIEQIDVFSQQDAERAPVEPTPSMRSSRFGLSSFTVQYWDGESWRTVPGGWARGNTHVWWQVTFAPLTTTKIRVFVTAAQGEWSRLMEVEAWGSP